MSSGLRSTIEATVDRAARATGVLTALSALGVFGFASAIIDPKFGFYLAIGSFGVFGAIEVFHRQSKEELQRRSAPSRANKLFEDMLSNKPKWQGKMIESFEYEGVLFNVLGFDQLPIPLGLSRPLCPQCNKPIIEKKSVKFPGRVQIDLECTCGYEKRLKHTISEITERAADRANLPS